MAGFTRKERNMGRKRRENVIAFPKGGMRGYEAKRRAQAEADRLHKLSHPAYPNTKGYSDTLRRVAGSVGAVALLVIGIGIAFIPIRWVRWLLAEIYAMQTMHNIYMVRNYYPMRCRHARILLWYSMVVIAGVVPAFVILPSRGIMTSAFYCVIWIDVVSDLTQTFAKELTAIRESHIVRKQERRHKKAMNKITRELKNPCGK